MFEINLQNKVVRLQSIDKPESTPNFPKVNTDTTPSTLGPPVRATLPSVDESAMENSTVMEAPSPEKDKGAWPDHLTEKLSPLLPSSTITSLKEMFLPGPIPPVSGPRLSEEMNATNNIKIENTSPTSASAAPIHLPKDAELTKPSKATRGGRGDGGRDSGRGRSRGSRGEGRQMRSDTRTVLTEVSAAAITHINFTILHDQ